MWQPRIHGGVGRLAVPHTERPPGEPEVRKHLVEQWRDFYVLMVRTLLDGSEEWGRYAHNQLHPPLRALESGQRIMFSRSDLPPGHLLEAPTAGRPTDRLVIDERDVVREL